MFRALTQIGCLCRPVAPPMGGVYSLETLKMIPLSTGQTSYLSNDMIRTVFLYKFAQDTRQVWAVIDTESATGSFFIVQRGDLTMPNMDRIYAQTFSEEKDQLVSNSIQSAIKFNIRHFRVVAEAEKEINKAIRLSREATAKPTLLCLLVDEEPKLMMKRLVNLNLFPHVRIHVQEPHALLNVMEWQRVVAKRICKHYFNSFIYFKDYADWARYLHVPIGSVPSDAGLFGLDLLFARHLQRTGHALWASAASRPDLGGKEIDDLRLTSEWKPLTKDETVLLNNPAFCGSVCIEFELEAVA
ncbi:unnamed protein product, partial [Cylicostephanus goldi]